MYPAEASTQKRQGQVDSCLCLFYKRSTPTPFLRPAWHYPPSTSGNRSLLQASTEYISHTSVHLNERIKSFYSSLIGSARSTIFFCQKCTDQSFFIIVGNAWTLLLLLSPVHMHDFEPGLGIVANPRLNTPHWSTDGQFVWLRVAHSAAWLRSQSIRGGTEAECAEDFAKVVMRAVEMAAVVPNGVGGGEEEGSRASSE